MLPHGLDAVIIDPGTSDHVATCSRTVNAPAASQILRVDVLTHQGTPFLKWETAPPPQPAKGAAMSEEMQAWTRKFQAAYRCGVLAVRVSDGTCRLEPIGFAQAGLESCPTRRLPTLPLMPARVGDLSLRVENGPQHEVSQPGVRQASHLLVVTTTNGAELWRTEVAHELFQPPPP